MQSRAWTSQAFAAESACAYAEAHPLLADAALQGSWLQHLGGDGEGLLKAAEKVRARWLDQKLQTEGKCYWQLPDCPELLVQPQADVKNLGWKPQGVVGVGEGGVGLTQPAAALADAAAAALTHSAAAAASTHVCAAAASGSATLCWRAAVVGCCQREELRWWILGVQQGPSSLPQQVHERCEVRRALCLAQCQSPPGLYLHHTNHL